MPTELPRTPQSPALCASIPPSEETLANADGEPPTTFESSSVEAAPHDIEPSIQPSAEMPSTPHNIQKPA